MKRYEMIFPYYPYLIEVKTNLIYCFQLCSKRVVAPESLFTQTTNTLINTVF